MAASTPKDAAIPRYLRYKAEEKHSDDYWDAELERANSILHTRVLRVRRDKLCTGCARFDILRTHFYTRGCIPQDEQQAAQCRTVKNFGTRFLRDQYIRDLSGMRDDVDWHGFETIQGIEEGVMLLAQHSEFQWRLEIEDGLACTLCSMLFYTGKAEYRLRSWLLPSKDLHLEISLRAGALFDEGGKHTCREGWETLELRATNAMLAYIFEYKNGRRYNLTTRTIRPIAEDIENLIGNMYPPMPHCCIMQHNVQASVDFSRLMEWIQTCDTRHKHTSDLPTAPRELFGFRLIDFKNQCIVERDLHTRYAALSYTWGASGQYCLTTSNRPLLGKEGSLEQINQGLRPIVVDAMRVCTRLGIPYLWVDALCIVQDDVAGKHQQIQNMDVIYASAYITLVGAADEDESHPSERIPTPGLARVTRPAVSPRSSLTMDSVLYSYSHRSLISPHDDIARSTWFSRGWTFQELVLSRRMLVFTAKEVFFYCPAGVLSESVSMGGDRCEPILLTDISSMQLCGLLHTLKTDQRSQTTSASIGHYNSVYLTLLDFYAGRVLTYDTDVLDAFSGVINAQLRMLGQFYWGLPRGLFARALLQSRTLGPGDTMSRRPGFPSWSWLGWKPEEPGNHDTFRRYFLPPLFSLVHIYKHDEQSYLELLMEPRDDRGGMEGYCVDSIEHYNALTKLDPLPRWPCINKVPKFPHIFRQESVPVLLFWTHVARFAASALENNRALFYMNECSDRRARVSSAHIEVVLVATTRPSPGVTCLQGIAIERHSGYARRIGPVLDIPPPTWLAGNPKKELILLI